VDIGVNCDPATLRRIRRLRIAMVFQQFGLLPWRTVRDNVGFGLELRGDPPDKRRRIIDQQLELVGQGRHRRAAGLMPFRSYVPAAMVGESVA